MILHRDGIVSDLSMLLFQNRYNLFEYIKLNIKSQFVDLDKIYLDINFKNLEKINKLRVDAINEGKFPEEGIKFFNASIKYLDQTIPIKISLKTGTIGYHTKSKNLSFRVKVLKKNNILGLTEFALMDAKRRNYILEWYARKLNQEVGLFYKEYKFVNLILNGENFGLYVVDENFTNNLATKNKKKDWVVLRYNVYISFNTKFGSYMDVVIDNFKAATIDAKNDKINFKNYEYNDDKIKKFLIAKSLLESFRSEKLNAEEVFDLESMAKGFAIAAAIVFG